MDAIMRLFGILLCFLFVGALLSGFAEWEVTKWKTSLPALFSRSSAEESDHNSKRRRINRCPTVAMTTPDR